MIRLLLLKTMRDLKKALAQTVALVFVVFLGVSSYVSLVGAYRDLGTSYQHTYQRLGFADLTYALLPNEEGVAKRIAHLEGVSAVIGRLIVDAGLQLPGSENEPPGKEKQIRSRLIGLPEDNPPQVNNVLILEGRYLLPADQHAVLIESHFAKTYSLSPGDVITPIINGKKRPFTIVGVAASPEYLIVSPSKQEFVPTARTFAVLFVSQKELQEIAGLPGLINNIAVRIKPGVDETALKNDIKARLKPLGLISTTPVADQPSNNALQSDLVGYREISDLMPGIILLVAAFSVYVMLGRQVRSQQAQIGLMKALGYHNGVVMAHYLAYALLIGIIGSLLGVLAGMALASEITTMYAEEMGIPLVQTRFYPDLIWKGILLSLVFSFLSGIGPALGSMRLPPASAMRLDPTGAQTKRRRSLFDRLILLPVWLRVSLRNIFRVRRRSFSTGLGVVFAFILLLMTWGMLDSMKYIMDQNFRVISRWDMMVSFNDFQGSSVLQKVVGSSGVLRVEPAFQIPATLKPDAEEKDIILTAYSRGQELNALQVVSGGSVEEALAPGKIVLTSVLADKLKLQPGDPVELEVLGRKRTLILGGTVEEMMVANGYISSETASGQLSLPAQGFTTLYLRIDPAQGVRIRSEMYHLTDVAAVLLKNEVEEDWRAMMGLFYAFVGMMIVFAAGMAFAVLFNAMTVNVLERQREFATMRSIGAWRGRIVWMLVTEILCLWALTVIPGILAGNWVAMEMGKAFQTELFYFKMVIAPSSYILSALAILGTMLISTLPSIRWVNRLNLAEATKVLT